MDEILRTLGVVFVMLLALFLGACFIAWVCDAWSKIANYPRANALQASNDELREMLNERGRRLLDLEREFAALKQPPSIVEENYEGLLQS